jgi:hypothetical protein
MEGSCFWYSHLSGKLKSPNRPPVVPAKSTGSGPEGRTSTFKPLRIARVKSAMSHATISQNNRLMKTIRHCLSEVRLWERGG